MATYVALRRIRVGPEHLMPGDELPELEEARNINLLLRQGLIADLDAQASSGEEQQQATDALTARVAQLEGLLAAAQGELGEVRAQLAKAPEDESAARVAELEVLLGEKDTEIATLREAQAASSEPQEGTETAPEVPLEQMTKAQLLETAQAAGVAVDASATKARIIELHQALVEGQPGEGD